MRIFWYLIVATMVFGQTVRVDVDRYRITKDDRITLSVKAVGSESFAELDISPIKKDFMILSGPGQQKTFQSFNGKITSSKTLTWTLSPKKDGTLTIPRLSGTIDGKPFNSKPIKMHVMRSATSSDNAVFLVAEVDKEKAHLGEQITLTYKLYKNPKATIASIDQFKMPDFKGFWAEEIYTPQQLKFHAQQETLNGVKYQVANLGQRALFPIPAQKHVVPQLEWKIGVEKKTQRRRNPFSDPFLGLLIPEITTKILKTDPKKIKIVPFPEPKPLDFKGAVGSFQISMTTDRDTAKVNEALAVTISLTGTGNLELFSLPRIRFSDKIEAFPPTDEFQKNKLRDPLTGTKTCEYILIPRMAGYFTIPRVQMSYYNPESNNWVRIQTDPKEIPILSGKADITFGSGLTKREIILQGRDINYIHTELSGLKNSSGFQTNMAVIFYICSILLFVSPNLVSRYTGHRLASIESRLIRGALKTAKKELKKPSDDPFNIASRAFYHYLKNKLLLPSHNLDPASAEDILSSRVSQENLDTVLELLKACDAGRYAPGGIERESTILSEMEKSLKNIDGELR